MLYMLIKWLALYHRSKEYRLKIWPHLKGLFSFSSCKIYNWCFFFTATLHIILTSLSYVIGRDHKFKPLCRQRICNENILDVPNRHYIDAVTKKSYFVIEMFFGSQDKIFKSPTNDVRCISVNTQHDVLSETSTVNISKTKTDMTKL